MRLTIRSIAVCVAAAMTLLCPGLAHAATLTAAQSAALKADIGSNATTVACGAFTGAVSAAPNSSDCNLAIAAVYNATASPDFWVWRTSVSQIEIVTATSVDGTTWSWTDYIGRSQGERDGWREMFADGGIVNAALANVRSGFADIFSGVAGAAQRTHLLAIGRRKATRAEKLFAAGSGSTASPAVMALEGALTSSNILDARNS